MSCKRYQLVIFDFDGTVADTKEGIAETLNQTLIHFGYVPVAPERIYGLIGLSLGTIFERIVGREINKEPVETLVDYYREIYDSVAPPKTKLFGGMQEVLDYLQKTQTLIAIATSKGLRGVTRMLDTLRIRDKFACIITDHSVAKKKPQPDMLHRILNEIGIESKDALIVGDTVYDVKMGKNAGVDTCAVTYGVHGHDELSRELPTYLVDSPRELLEVIVR
jgi:HAD superfamily hydrolase (TIGR01509 family)